MSASAAFPDFGNGVGYIYYTDEAGTFPPPSWTFLAYDLPATGEPNLASVKLYAMMRAAYMAPPPGSTHAYAVFTVTSAAADNLSTLTIDGVSQITAAVAMTVGDTTASATSIKNAINSHVAASGSDYSASSSANVVYIRRVNAGSGGNGDIVAFSFSGASTATTTTVGGGDEVGNPRFRIWLDANYSASPSATVKSASAVDITEFVWKLGLESPRRIGVATISGGTTVLERESSDATFYLNGTNAPPNNRLQELTYLGANPGDRIRFIGDSALLPSVIENGTVNIVMKGLGDMDLVSAVDSIVLEYNEDNGTEQWFEVNRSPFIDSTRARANGIVVPLNAGTHIQTVPGSGSLTIAPGLTGTPPANTTYKSIVKLQGTISLVGNYSIQLDPSGSLLAGDRGIIYGGTSNVTVGAFAITVSDAVVTFNRIIPAPLALTGNWAVEWLYDGSNFNATLVPGIDTAGSITNAALAAGAVTDAKVTDVSGTKLTNATVSLAKLDSSLQLTISAIQIYTVTRVVTSAEILTGNATPIDLIAAPGAGFAIHVISVTEQVFFNTTVYATNTTYDIKAQTATVGQYRSTGGLLATVNTKRIVPQFTTFAAGSTQIVENVPIQFFVPAGDPTAGDSDIEITLNYRVVTF